MDVVPRRYTKTNYEIIDVGYKAPVYRPEWTDGILELRNETGTFKHPRFVFALFCGQIDMKTGFHDRRRAICSGSHSSSSKLLIYTSQKDRISFSSRAKKLSYTPTTRILAARAP